MLLASRGRAWSFNSLRKHRVSSIEVETEHFRSVFDGKQTVKINFLRKYIYWTLMISSRSCSLAKSFVFFPRSLWVDQSAGKSLRALAENRRANENKHKLRSRSLWRVNSCVSQTHVSLRARQIDYVRFAQLISFLPSPSTCSNLLIAFDYEWVDWKMKCRDFWPTLNDGCWRVWKAKTKSTENIEFNRGQITRNEAWKI